MPGPYVFTPGIPLSTDIPAQSASQFATNFTSINDWVQEDHVQFNSANAGKHNKTRFVEQAIDVTTAVNEIALYSKEVTGITQLFIRRENNGDIIDFTSSTLNTTGEATLPCGLKLKWGRGTSGAGGAETITFANAFPSTIYTAYVTIAMTGGSPASSESQDRAVRIYNYDTTKLQTTCYVDNTARTRAVGQTYMWLALGI